MQKLVQYLNEPEKFNLMGCKIPRGVLLSGSQLFFRFAHYLEDYNYKAIRHILSFAYQDSSKEGLAQ